MTKLNETSMRTRYFGSYLGIVLFACILIGLLGLGHATREINDVSVMDYKEKMRLTVDELELQQEIMENISYRIKGSAMYRPFFIYRNAYYEVEIVDDFKKFKDYSPLIDQYYCIQLDTGNVYSTIGKLSIEHFAQYRLQSSPEAVDEFFTSTDFRILPHPADHDTLMFVLPFRIQSDGNRTVPDTCLIFMVRREALAGRLERIGALDLSEVSLYWNDLLLLGDGNIAQAKDALCMTSESGNYRIYSSVEPGQIYPHLQSFSHYFLAVLILVTVVLMALAAYVAYRNYKPVDRLIDRLNIPPNGSAQDIEDAVKELQDINRSTEAQLQSSLIDFARQRREIARQLLFTRLSGVHDAQLDVLLKDAGIAMEHSLFCVLLVHFRQEHGGEELVSSMVQSLSDSDVSIYPAGVYQQQHHILLINFDSREQLDELCTVILESLSIEAGGAQLYVGDICEDKSQLPISFVSAISHRETEYPLPTPPASDQEAAWYDDRQVRLMMQALVEGNAEKAKTCLTEVERLLKEQYPSQLLQRCIWADIGNQLMRTVKGMELPLDHKGLQFLLVAADTGGFVQRLSEFIDCTLAASTERTAQENDRMESDVVAYIKERFFLPQFTTADVAEHFSISERKVGNVVKLATGIPYKEFIIKLRMERAKMLLANEEYNVSQTSESVGYNNIPYFIKTFRNYTGYTPGEYKKLFDQRDKSRNE